MATEQFKMSEGFNVLASIDSITVDSWHAVVDGKDKKRTIAVLRNQMGQTAEYVRVDDPSSHPCPMTDSLAVAKLLNHLTNAREAELKVRGSSAWLKVLAGLITSPVFSDKGLNFVAGTPPEALTKEGNTMFVVKAEPTLRPFDEGVIIAVDTKASKFYAGRVALGQDVEDIATRAAESGLTVHVIDHENWRDALTDLVANRSEQTQG